MPRQNQDLLIPPADQIESVTEFTKKVKYLLETEIGGAWIRGEVSNLRRQQSGHVYFSLKDEGSQVAAVMFRNDALNQSVEVRDGAQVIVFGQISVYEPRGNYQLIVRLVVDDGLGRLQQEFERLKARLSGEGLFDGARKQPIPTFPRAVGIVTSPTGAAVQDFIRILKRREWVGHVVVLPVKVQGAGAAQEIA
ncbi:MAG: exodeoxyribonuclease VII large subunit, partial [Verrucomicrobiae bacterium]|nr:exodeoxyribonuclease VII large subunit [Verrucomicrobiae bacterium]